ncbi:MAG: hypothetical protein CME18_02570 [Gemmatimonadetes bacterium]|nr:hypothetical protein [Gemmatimonadota bacterium]MEE2862679.1 hypothetical protein [Gemmatimonadota bacterium]
MGELWILIPAPFMGYFVIDHFRKLFSDDPNFVREVFKSQPVTMVAAATALGAAIVWGLSEVGQRFVGILF